jgi:hypothetical protein
MTHFRAPNELVYIYMLVDPQTREVGYIGQTTNVHARYMAHLRNAKKYVWNSPKKVDWLQDILRRGDKPEMVIITEVPASLADYTEEFWIVRYKKLGHPLTNATPLTRQNPKSLKCLVKHAGAVQVSLFQEGDHA